MFEGSRIKITWETLLRYAFSAFLLACTIYFIDCYNLGKFDAGEFYLTLYCTFCCWFGSLFITLFCERMFRRIEQTLIRVIVNIVLILAFIYFVVQVALVIFENLTSEDFRQTYITCTAVTIFVSTIYLTVDYFKLYKEKVKETEELKRLQIENELKILSNQVNPHFLFNSLNTLMAIIPDDTQKALHFTESFSKVYRYALKNRHTETVTLREEIELINDYCYLLKIRFGKNFTFNIDISEQALEAIIPPFVIQLLVENATKHNAISVGEPLVLLIFIEGDSVIVKNNINRKISESNGTGTGLENISRRLKYLTGKSLKVIKNDAYFIVSVPLIFAEEYESDHYRG